MKRNKMLIGSLVLALACLASGVAFSANNNVLSANAATTVKTVNEVSLVMKNGASVRYASSATDSGIRFSVNLSAEDYLGLEANEGKVYSSVSYGMALMPYSYLETYGELTEDNLFGKNAKYDWAQWNGSDWVYEGDNTSKKRIICLSYGEMVVDNDNSNYYVFNGSMSGIQNENLARDFVGRGYIKAVKMDGTIEYVMADYTGDNVHNNVRSIVEVAEKAVADPDLTDQTKLDKLAEYYINATDVRYVKFYDDEYLLAAHQTKKNYAFADEVAFDGTDVDFDHWEDENGNTVVLDSNYELVGTTKVYAVYSDAVAKVSAAQTAIDTFLGMSVSQATVVAVQNQYQVVKDALNTLRAKDYNEMIAKDGASINAKADEINTVLENASDLYKQYEGTLFAGDALVNSVTVQLPDGTKPHSKGASALIENGVQADPSGTAKKTWEITLPAIDYTDFVSVHFEWKTSATGSSLYVANGNGIAWNYSYNGGNVDITNNGNGTITVVISATDGPSSSTTVSDSAIVNGTAGLKLSSQLEAYRQIAIGPITAKCLYDVWSVESEAVLYTGQAMLDNTSVLNASGGKPYSKAASSNITGGVNFDCSGTGATDWTIYLPKVNYAAYQTVSMSFQATNNWQTFGFVSGGRIADSGGSALTGTITFTNNGDGTVTCVISEAVKGNISYTITDSNVLNGTTAFTLFWNQGAVYRQLSIGPISATMDLDGRMEIAKQAGKQPKTVVETLYAGADFKNATSYSCDSDSSKTMTFKAGAYSDTEGWADGICFDVSGNGGYNWTINFPAVDYASYTKLSFEWRASAWTGFGVQGGNFLTATGATRSGTVVIVNNGNGTKTVTVTADTGATSVATIGINDAIQFKANMSAYHRLCFSKVTAEYAVKASTVEELSLEEKEVVYGVPYFFVAQNVLYSGQSLISNVSITPNTNVTINHYNDFFPNAVQFDPGAGNTADRVISLPKIVYADYETISMEFKGRNGSQTFGFVNGDRLSDGGSAFVGTITFTNNYNGTVTCVINATSTGGSVSYTITDVDIINGIAPMTFFWNNGNSYRQILIGEITGYNGKAALSTVPFEYQLTDFNASTYETTVYDTDATDRGELLVRTNGDGALYLETQNVSGSDATENIYTISLPWVDFTSVNYIKTSFTTNNGTGIGLTTGDFIPVGTSTSLMVQKNITNGSVSLEATLTNSNGTTVKTTITDADIICGNKGVSLYVKGIQYTEYSISNLIANGKSGVVLLQSQDINLALEGNGDGYAAYRIAWDANDEGTNDYHNYKFAAEELASFLGRWTGERYQTVKMYEGAVVENNHKLIVLGGKLAEDAGLNTDGIEKSNGYKIVQDYTNLYIYSETSEGTLAALYGFLKEQANVVFYTDEVFTENVTEFSTVVTAGTSITFNPSFNVAQTGYAEMQYSEEYQRRLGMYADWDVMTGLALKDAATVWDKQNITNGHNMLDIFPYETFASTYSDWYIKDAGDTWQLNFTASNTHLQEMKDMLVASAKVVIANMPQYKYFEFAQPDSSYGPDVAGYLSFMNDVAATLNAWLAVENPDRTIALVMYAYNGTNMAPGDGSIYNGENVYVTVYFAPVGSRYPFKIDDSNNYWKNTSTNAFDTSETIYEKLLSWTKLEGFNKDRNLIYWMYGTDFYNYMMPMDTISNLQYNYQKLHEMGTDMIKYQFQTKNRDNVGSDWQRLKTYLSSELTKDVNADVATLQANFMNAMYGAGATYMQQLLSAQQAHCTYDNFNSLDSALYSNYTEQYFGIINGSTKLMSTRYFSKDALNTWMGYINSAKAAVNADVNLSADEKAGYIERIEVEALSIRYMLVSLHSVTTYDASVDAWKAHAASLGCYCYMEGSNINGNW